MRGCLVPFCSPRSDLLNILSELLRIEPAGADAPEINGELARDGYDGFLARSAGSQRTFAENASPFHDRFVIGLEANQSPGQLHQGGVQSRIAVPGHTALDACLTPRVFAQHA